MIDRFALSLSAVLVCAAAAISQPAADAPPLLLPAEPDPAIGSALTTVAPGSSVDNRFWFGGDYLFARLQSAKAPILITTSTDGTARTIAGSLGYTSTQAIFGGAMNDDIRAGLRLGAGWWFYPNWGLEFGFTMLESQSTLFSVGSDGSVTLARPYYDSTTKLSQAVLVAYPGSSSGSIGIRATSGNYYTGNLDLVERVIDTGSFRLDALLGYRYYSYNEVMRIQQNIFPTDSNFVAGTAITSLDNFWTQNQFNGLDLGLRTSFQWETLSLDLLAKVAFGRLHTIANIGGLQSTTVPGSDPVVANNGVYALGTNIGSYSAYKLAASPEFGATLRWQVSSSVQLRLSYSFQLMSGVLRAVDQINTMIDPANFSSTSPSGQPTFQFQRSDIWIQSVSAGMVFSF